MSWKWWHPSSGPDNYQARDLLRGIWDLHAMYDDGQPWLWRGQANADHVLEPAIHTRLRTNALAVNDVEVQNRTDVLIQAARNAALDYHEGTRLPEMALLAMLQHHGAATPLLDVSLDPLVGLYMATVSPNRDDDNRNGALFAIRRPKESLSDFDSRSFPGIYNSIGGGVVLYTAPDVSERLRIQRGHFLLGRHSTANGRVAIPLTLDPAKVQEDMWISKRMKARGKKGPPAVATSDIAVFRITARLKKDIRDWLEARSGLTRDFVYPTPWHQPHLDRFASSHGRTAPL